MQFYKIFPALLDRAAGCRSYAPKDPNFMQFYEKTPAPGEQAKLLPKCRNSRPRTMSHKHNGVRFHRSPNIALCRRKQQIVDKPSTADASCHRHQRPAAHVSHILKRVRIDDTAVIHLNRRFLPQDAQSPGKQLG